jgi:hypothetical protein
MSIVRAAGIPWPAVAPPGAPHSMLYNRIV